MKSILFLMPGPGNRATGGGKVIYEYANRLIVDGYPVTIVYPATSYFGHYSFCGKIRAVLGYLYYLLRRKYVPYQWFNLDRRVQLHFVWSLSEQRVPLADIYIATALATAEYLNTYRNVSSEHKIYLIQGYESWDWGEERFLTSLRFAMSKITIAPHLLRAIEKQGNHGTMIELGLDFDYFHPTRSIADKDRFVVAMLYHTAPLKGVADGFAALELARKTYPQIHVILFGHFPPPKELPEWVEYYQQPNQAIHNDIYGRAAIYIGPSHSEGFNLTVAEAMQCGCAVVCTDIGGYASLCIDGQTALVSPVKDIEAMASNIIRLIDDTELRHTLAHNALQKVQLYTWKRAYRQFKYEIDQV